jgi:hypothetical protein
MYLLGRHAGLDHRGLCGIHERARPADKGLTGIGHPGRGPGCELLLRRRALHGVQPVNDLQAIRILGRQLLQVLLEDDRALIAVGIEQHHIALMLLENGAQDGEHRCDSAATGQQQKVLRQIPGREQARGRHQLDGVTHLNPVANPVGASSLVDALDSHPQGIVEHRGTGHGVAARHIAALDRQSQSQKLAGTIAELLSQSLWHLEHN